MLIFLFVLSIPFLVRFIKRFFFWDIPTGLVLFTGIPGAGKTTICAYFSKVFHKRKHYKGMNIYSNVPIKDTLSYEPKELGSYEMSGDRGSVLLCDEAGIVFNNRRFKTLPDNVIFFAKMFRHYGVRSFLFFSQGLDIDITFIRLCREICIVRKSIIPFFVCVREVSKYIGIDEMSHQLVDQYSFKKFGMHLIFAPTCWSLFDTYDCPPLPQKTFYKWGEQPSEVISS